MTLAEARSKLTSIPAFAVNSNCVQDGCFRLREALTLAERSRSPSDPAPGYVVEAVRGLQSWIDHAAKRAA